MLGNSYQNGPYFEVWDSKVNQDKNQLYKNLFRVYPSSINKYFDKSVKSYLYSLQGQTARICLPANDQRELALHQKYLVLHIYIPIGASWSMELGITDINSIKRRINLTTVQGKQQIKYFSLRYPIEMLERGNWVFMAFNIYSFMEAFKDQVFRSLDHITIGSNCKIRRIFTMKEWDQIQIPKHFWFHSQILQEFQLIEYQSQTLPKISMNKHMINQSEPGQSLYEKLTPNKRESKIALAKSQINHSNNMAKSKLYQPNRSPSKPVSLEPITKKKSYVNNKFSSKLRLNSMRDELFDHNVEYIIQNNGKVNSYLNEKQKSSLGHYQKLKGSNHKKMTATKSPKIQKSFQEDEALNFQPGQSDVAIQETSRQSLQENSYSRIKNVQVAQKVEKSKVSRRPEEKWSSDQQKIMIKHHENTGEQKEQKISKNIERTIIKKQNNQIKVVTQAKKDNQIELIYDQMVECYYHPQTHTYYEIKQE